MTIRDIREILEIAHKYICEKHGNNYRIVSVNWHDTISDNAKWCDDETRLIRNGLFTAHNEIPHWSVTFTDEFDEERWIININGSGIIKTVV